MLIPQHAILTLVLGLPESNFGSVGLCSIRKFDGDESAQREAQAF